MSQIEESVINKIRCRAVAGMAKYGQSLERADFTRLQWLEHAQEEAMDLAAYLEKLIQEEKAGQDAYHRGFNDGIKHATALVHRAVIAENK